MLSLGVRLQVLIGKNVPAPAPFAVMDSFIEAEVTNRDNAFDGFKISFAKGSGSLLEQSGLLDPPNRVIIVAHFGLTPQVLIDGIITSNETSVSNTPGHSQFHVFGKDISVKLSLKETKETKPNQSDSSIVTEILNAYPDLGLTPQITATSDVPNENQRITSQQGNDLNFIRELAKRNGFVFYIEPTTTPSVNIAYWGVENRKKSAYPPLTINRGPDTNIDAPITLSFDALAATEPQVKITDPSTKLSISIPAPGGLLSPLAQRSAPALRKTEPGGTAKLDAIQGALKALIEAGASSGAVATQVNLNTVRYGQALQARRIVALCGASKNMDGDYYISEVTHSIKRGEYKQELKLRREGLGSIGSPCMDTSGFVRWGW